MGRVARTVAVVAGVALLAPASAAALSLDPIDDFDYNSPVFVTSGPNDADLLFVVEQDGVIRMSDDGVVTPFLDIADLVRSPADAGGGNEQGLLSMAIAPDYATSGHFYVFYTAQEGGAGDLRIDEFDADQPPIEDSRRPVISIPHVGAAQNHNGGQLQFGPGELLYASTGDGGTGGANAQDPESLLGKVIRIDPEQSGPDPYTVPSTNPFVGVAGEDEIWSLGLRNPWRFSFDRANGAIAIGDVGQGSWEEIDFEPAPNAGRGDNFGWPCREGMHAFAACADPPPFTEPVFEYENLGFPEACAITGGYVARDPSLGALHGRYLYADLCAGDIRSVCLSLPAASRDRSEGLPPVQTPTSFGEDASGRVYVVERTGTVSRLTGPASPGACPSSPPPPGPQPPSPDDADVTPPDLSLAAKRRHDVGDSRVLKVEAAVDEPAEVELRAKVGLGSRTLRLGTESSAVDATGAEKLKWKLTRAEARRVRRRLAHGRRSKARVKGRATDAAGNASQAGSVKIRLGR